MPILDLAEARDLDQAIERLVGAPDFRSALPRLKEIFVELLDFEPAAGSLPLYSDGLPPDAQRVAQRDGVHVVAAALPKDGRITAAEAKAALRDIRRTLGGDILLVATDHTQSQWHFIYPRDTAGREVLRRMVVERGQPRRTVVQQFAGVYHDVLRRGDLRGALERAYDVEAVTKRFFEQYRRVFEQVEQLVQGLEEPERKRLFVQRLFNRLMFIAFVQKKGWLKLGGETDYLAALWKHYRRDGADGGNFYLERLKKLFFMGLSTSHEVNLVGIRRDGLLQEFIGDVPYLNGGLFEQDDDDSDDHVAVPDECIAAILEGLFNRFNFTVTESTPLDVEVAVDPEMLGKVFEELVTGRHETGSYYTPKPVVSFMGREALKGYLETALSEESSEAIERFVEDHEPARLRNPEKALDALRRAKICDPACGSGAYLLGMLHELLDLRQSLFATKGLDPKTMYQRKLEIIESCLYGVDIDPFAVNIARLRLWLSLAVEFEGASPPPLPNLDFKIEVGDSLSAPAPNPDALNMDARQHLVRQLAEKKAAYLTAHHGQKLTLKKEIDALRESIVQWTYGGAPVKGFDWAVEFAEVFLDGGFDIVLANPPYVRMELFKDQKPVLRKNFPLVHSDRADLYCYFYARAVELLRQGGMLAFISSNKWLRANYGTNLRKHIAEMCQVHSITDFGELPVFQSGATFPMVFVAQRWLARGTQADAEFGCVFTQAQSLGPPYPDVRALVRERGQRLPIDALDGARWTLTDAASASRMRQMEMAGVPLRDYVQGQICWGIKTGFNTAFVIDGAKRAELIAQDGRSAEVIKPLAVGDDVRRWRVVFRDRWLLYMYHGIDPDSMPAITAHLRPYRHQLEQRATDQEWYELQQPQMAYVPSYMAPKIVYPIIAKEPRFAFDIAAIFTNDKTYVIPVHDLYLLGVLNSACAWDYLKNVCSVLGDPNRGGRLELRRVFVEKIPIPRAAVTEREAIAGLSQKCLDAKGVGCEQWEREIDERVATLYGVSLPSE